MKRLKKIISILCAIAMLFSNITFAPAEDIDTAEQEMTQIAGE